MTVPAHEKMQIRLTDKIVKNAEKIIRFEASNLDDAEVVVVSYGITSRVAQKAIQQAKDQGIRVGSFRLITAWPFPEKQIIELSKKVKAFVVPELNLGQMVLEVERLANGRCRTIPVPHVGGTVHDPSVILKKIQEAVR
jgi:2-oxoglutarate ferredoxin oxidoreductase subunit alpha